MTGERRFKAFNCPAITSDNICYVAFAGGAAEKRSFVSLLGLRYQRNPRAGGYFRCERFGSRKPVMHTTTTNPAAIPHASSELSVPGKRAGNWAQAEDAVRCIAVWAAIGSMSYQYTGYPTRVKERPGCSRNSPIGVANWRNHRVGTESVFHLSDRRRAQRA